jgi:hypothetical protein
MGSQKVTSPVSQGSHLGSISHLPKNAVGASRSRRDRARERDAPTTNLQLGDAPSHLNLMPLRRNPVSQSISSLLPFEMLLKPIALVLQQTCH